MKYKIADGTQYCHSIILYDSKKTTVSSSIATTTLQVTVKGQVISYYDSNQKFWYLRGTEEDVNKMINALKTCNVNIKVSNEENNPLPVENKSKKNVVTDAVKEVVQSDTDSSTNRKTKASILNRMASMGQSVLPQQVAIQPSSDSDTSEDEIIAVRHKPVKNITTKKPLSEKAISDRRKADVHKAVVPIAQFQDNNTYMRIDNQLHSSTPIATASGHDLNYFFTEQRISNSELRLNVTRMTDKVDNILDKVNNLEKDKSEVSAINTTIYQKLIQEYESKIKTYEEIIQNINKNTFNISKQNLSSDMTENNELVTKLNNKITELDNCIKQKDDEISVLNNEIKKLKSYEENSREVESKFQAKLSEYEEVINKNNGMLSKLTTENDQLLNSHNKELEHKIKSIMNETFQAIEINFDKNETYSGERIKVIIGTVIKKLTMESLKDLKST